MKEAAGDRLDAVEIPAKNHQNVGTRILAGRMGQRNITAGTTQQLTLETQADFYAVRLIIGNAAKNISDRIIGVSASVTDSAADLNNSSGSWVTGTKDGIGAFATDMAPAINHTGYAVSDWIPVKSIPRTDGGTKPLLIVRARTGGNSTMSVAGDGTDDFTNWASRTDGHLWAWREQVVDAITTPASFTSTTNISQSFIVGVQYLSRGRVITGRLGRLHRRGARHLHRRRLHASCLRRLGRCDRCPGRVRQLRLVGSGDRDVRVARPVPDEIPGPPRCARRPERLTE